MAETFRNIKRVFLSPLARQYLTWTVLFGGFLTLLITGAEVYYQFLDKTSNINQQLEEVTTIYQQGLARSWWQFNTVQTKAILDGIILNPVVSAVQIIDGQVVEQSGIIPEKNSISHKTAIYYQSQQANTYLGEMLVFADITSVYKDVSRFAASRLTINFIKSLLLMSFSFFVFYVLVNRHLKKISAYTLSGALLRTGTRPLALDERHAFAYFRTDELDEVVSAINQLSHELQRTIQEVIDISHETEQINRQLAHARRMESLGILVGSVSHEFNNSLAIISGAVDLMQDDGDLSYRDTKTATND